MAKKIIFTTAPFIVDERENVNSAGNTALCFAIYYLSTIMQKRGYKVTIVDPVNFQALLDSVAYNLNEIRQYDYICISVNSFNWWKIKEFLDLLENRKDIPPVILGGIHASALYEYILQMFRVNIYIVIGEGERTLPELIDTLERGGDVRSVQGIAYRPGDEIVVNQSHHKSILENFAENILVDYSQLPRGIYRYFPIATSIGCPYSCTFCSIWSKNSYRLIPQELFTKQLEHVKRFQEKLVDNKLQIMIIDDNFTTNKNRLYELIEEIVNSYNKYHYFIESRASDLQYRKVVAGLSRINSLRIQIGVESGYDEGLEKIKKKTTIAQVNEAFENLSQYGMTYHSFQTYIIGFSWEGVTECKKTIDFAIDKLKHYPTQVFLNWLFILPNSEIFNNAKIDNLTAIYDISKWYQDLSIFFRTHRLSMNDFREILEYSQAFVQAFPNLFFSNLSIVQ
jgi:anaerobic magnesium-protoporphyrin IX monomethyl ester cyclase